MPIYEFACADCGHGFERLQKLSDADPIDCPACARPSIKRRISAPSFRLAGGGWYETDFKSDSDRKRNLAGGDDAAAKPAKDAAKDAGGKDGAKDGGKEPAKTETSASTSTTPAATPAAVA